MGASLGKPKHRHAVNGNLGVTIEFTNILFTTPLPVHPFFGAFPCLSVSLIEDKRVCAKTPAIHGNLATGIWGINSSLSANSVQQSVTLTFFAGYKRPRIRFASVKVSVSELLARLKVCQDGYQEFKIYDPSTSMQLIMTCTVNVLTVNSPPSHAGFYDNRALDREPDSSELPSRETLEILYATVARIPDHDRQKARGLSTLGRGYYILYQKGNDGTDLEMALSLHEDALRCTGPSDLAEHTYYLSETLIGRFRQNKDLMDIERAISCLQNALNITGRPDLLNNLGNVFLLRFFHLGDLSDVQNAISSLQMAVEMTADGDPSKPGWLTGLGNALQSRFERLGTLKDLEESISNRRRAIELTSDDDPVKPGRLNNLGNALRHRFERLGGLQDLEDAISNQRTAIELAPDGDPNKPSWLTSFSINLLCRFKRLGGLEDMEDAISNIRRAVQLTPDDHPQKPGYLNNLGLTLQYHFERLGNLEDLDDAISNRRRAVELTPDGHPDKPDRFGNLGTALTSRFECLGNLKDLEDAISNQRKAVETMPEGHPDKPRHLNNLGNVLRLSFKLIGNLQDLEDAISNQRRAIELTPDSHPDKPDQFGSLGIALKSRFGWLGNLEDLEGAISNQRRAVELTPDGHPQKPGRLSNLGSALEFKFQRLGNLKDLEDAISIHQRAVELTPNGDPDKPGRFGSLGTAFVFRFKCLGSLKDLEDAISNQQMAVELTPDGHPQKPDLLNNLGAALQYRFSRLGNLEDLEDAILNQRRIVELTPDGHTDKPHRLSNLGNGLHFRFERLANLDDLDDSISNRRGAVQLTPDGHPDKPARLSNLGSALWNRFQRLGNLEDLEDAILNIRKAVNLAPGGHPETPTMLNNLGIAFQLRFKRLGVLEDLESALSAFFSATNFPIGSAMGRFMAARAWANLSEAVGRSPLEAFRCAIDLLPRIAWLGLAVTDQHALLSDVGDIVRDAVSAAIRYEDYETAVVWAEQGRSVVWQNLLGLRTPVDKLRQTHPEMADRLHYIARQLEGPGSQEVNLAEILTASASTSHSKLAIEWDDLIEKIRNIPGFEGFLRAKSFRELAPAADEGPVVILNVNDLHCDALVLIADDSSERRVSAINIPLECFSHQKAKKLFHNLTELLSSAGVRERNDRKICIVGSRVGGEAKFKVILSILWKDVVKPVIEGLAFQTESERPPRIWWCATGLLAFLPIHAAGLYDTQEIGEKVSDFVVSSYAPTLNSIIELSGPVIRDDFQVLTVAQASAPGANPIPKTEDEVKIVQHLTTGARALNLKRENATVQRVRDGMIESDWIHLACHGQQHPDDPMSSGFLLHDDKLKLSEIVTMSLPKADFAFLSACQTAMGDEKVAEESVHLAAGMLLSGCRGIIATTWSIRDDDAPKIAQEVYSRMFKDGKPNRKEAAYALHEAVKLLRQSGADCVSWVPFVHIGR